MPPNRGAPTTTVAAATRSADSLGPLPILLAPPHTGLTGSASPTLYWWLSDDTRHPVELAILDDRRVDPVLAVRLERGAGAGVHALSLAEHRVVLEPGIEYEWSVALVLDAGERSRDIFTKAAIQRVARAEPPGTADPATRLAAAARQGLWYDAVDLSGRLIARNPGDAAPRNLRAALLEQVGLVEPAAWDRRSVVAGGS